jgi:hypothetical protein
LGKAVAEGKSLLPYPLVKGFEVFQYIADLIVIKIIKAQVPDELFPELFNV